MYLVCALMAESFDLDIWHGGRPFWRAAVDIRGLALRVQQRAKKSHYQSRVFVCVSNNRADVVDRLLIIHPCSISFKC